MPYSFDHHNLLVQSILLKGIPTDILRLDACFGKLSGNKFLKLRYLIPLLKQNSIRRIVSFGGAYSNHLYSLAALCQHYHVISLGIVRGEAVENPTLRACKQMGMQLEFCERHTFDAVTQNHGYDAWENPDTIVVPMGGNHLLGEQGVKDYFSNEIFKTYKTIICSVGTGTTLRGIASALPLARCIGVVSHKSTQNIATTHTASAYPNMEVEWEASLGRFGQIPPALLGYVNTFYDKHRIPLDLIYTAKTMHYLENKIEKLQGLLPLLFVHTGGLQGNGSHQQRLSFACET